jgi:nicotinamidase-related amidase
MMNNPNELTIENSAVVLIDHQPAVGLAVNSIERTVLVNNVSGLASAAKALGVPTVLSTIGAKGSVLVDPIFKEIQAIFPEITPIDRTTTHAWSDPKFRAAIDATGRRKLIMAGIVTGTCLSQSVLAAVKDGFEVYFVSDCSGDVTTEAHEDAKALMTQAGAHPITWMNASGQWAPDYTSKERALMTPIYTKYGGGGTNFLTDYALDQIAAGVVQPPSFISAASAKQVSG